MWVPFLRGSWPPLLPFLARPDALRTTGGRATCGRGRGWRSPWLTLLMVMLAGHAWLAAPRWSHAQQVSKLEIKVEPRIVARARSQVALPIRVEPVAALPKKGFVSLRGMPPKVTLTVGQSISPGSWTVSIADLAALKA